MGSSLFKDADITVVYKIDDLYVRYEQTSFCSAEVEIKDDNNEVHAAWYGSFNVNMNAAKLFDKYLKAPGKKLIAKPLNYTLGCPDLKIEGSMFYLTNHVVGENSDANRDWAKQEKYHYYDKLKIESVDCGVKTEDKQLFDCLKGIEYTKNYRKYLKFDTENCS